MGTWLAIGLGALAAWIATRTAGRGKGPERAALPRHHPRARRFIFLMQRAHELGKDDRFVDALAELDQVDPTGVAPMAMALWINNRAYFMARAGRAADALSELDDAEQLARNEETAVGTNLIGCIVGTRGIALHLVGRHDEAEAALQRALKLGVEAEVHEGQRGGPIREEEERLRAERWWWLSQIAAARGDLALQTERLSTAAGFDNGGRFAERARASLAGMKGTG
jgi:hypothetical protein